MPFRPPKCNCPDAIQSRRALPGASALSLQYNSDWSDDYEGIKERGGYCIHELAVLRIRKEIDDAFPDGIPKDIKSPVPPKFQDNEIVIKMQNPPTRGDDFS